MPSSFRYNCSNEVSDRIYVTVISTFRQVEGALPYGVKSTLHRVIRHDVGIVPYGKNAPFTKGSLGGRVKTLPYDVCLFCGRVKTLPYDIIDPA